MSYEHRSNVRRNSFPLPIKIAIIVACLLFVIYLIFPNLISNIVSSIVRPFWSSPNVLPNVSLELQNATIRELQQENIELKSILKANASTTAPHMYYIVKKPPFTVYDSYVVDVKSSNNVMIGDRVYAVGNVLIGEVSEVNAGFAKVKLYSSYGEKFDVLIGKKDIQASALGQGGGSFEVILPKDIKVSEGDIVTVPDFGTTVFGIVKNIKVDPARAFSTILFTQPINIYEQKVVFIYKK